MSRGPTDVSVTAARRTIRHLLCKSPLGLWIVHPVASLVQTRIQVRHRSEEAGCQWSESTRGTVDPSIPGIAELVQRTPGMHAQRARPKIPCVRTGRADDTHRLVFLTKMATTAAFYSVSPCLHIRADTSRGQTATHEERGLHAKGRDLSAVGSLTSQDSTGGQRPHQRTRPAQRNIRTKNEAEPDACMREAPEIRRRWDGDPCRLDIGLLWAAPAGDVVKPVYGKTAMLRRRGRASSSLFHPHCPPRRLVHPSPQPEAISLVKARKNSTNTSL